MSSPLLDPAREPLPLAPGPAGAAMASAALAVPDAVRSNAPIAARLGVDEDWIVARTGIYERRVAAPGATLADLATEAGRRALDAAGHDAADLDLVLLATTTPDKPMPNTAPVVAAQLGATRAGAIDIGAACTAFISAVALATAQLESGRAQSVLVIGADFLSRWLDPDDRRTAALFGDGAGAVLMTAVDGPGRIGPVVLRADGARADQIRAERGDGLIRMDGHETFKHAVLRLAEVSRQVLDAAGLELAEVDLFVYHQANGRILRAVGQRLELDPERVVSCVDRYGNTSAASIPIALAEAQADGRLPEGTRVLMAAFGAGFTWGGVTLEWGRGDA